MNHNLFNKVGELLFGPSWRTRMSEELKVGERTVRRWQNGVHPIPEGVRADLAELCREQAKKLKKMAQDLSA